MRNYARLALSLLVIIGFAGIARAEESKLTGTYTCAKCGLKEGGECQNVLVVKDGDKHKSAYAAVESMLDDTGSPRKGPLPPTTTATESSSCCVAVAPARSTTSAVAPS